MRSANTTRGLSRASTPVRPDTGLALKRGRRVTRHALTVDLEDWHQLFLPPCHRALVRERRATSSPTRSVSSNCSPSTDVRATFFVVGLVASAFPELVRQVCRGRPRDRLPHRRSSDPLLDQAGRFQGRTSSARASSSGSHRPARALLFALRRFSVGSLRNEAFLRDPGRGRVRVRLQRVSHRGAALTAFPTRRATRSPCRRRAGRSTSSPWRPGIWDTTDCRRRRHLLSLPARCLPRADRGRPRCRAGHTATFYFHPYELHRGLLHLSGLTWHDRLQTAYARPMVLHNLFTASVCGRWGSLLADHRFVPIGEIHDGEPIAH